MNSFRRKESLFFFQGIFTLLVQYHADVNQLFQNYLPGFILAVYLQQQSIIELYLRLGTDPNVSETNLNRTALHYAAYFHNNTTIFHLLLSSSIYHEIDINARDDNGFSVLDYARANIHNCTEFVDLLLQNNVFDPNRGELSLDDIEIEKPNIKQYQSSDELSSLKKKRKQEKKSKE